MSEMHNKATFASQTLCLARLCAFVFKCVEKVQVPEQPCRSPSVTEAITQQSVHFALHYLLVKIMQIRTYCIYTHTHTWPPTHICVFPHRPDNDKLSAEAAESHFKVVCILKQSGSKGLSYPGRLPRKPS